MESPLQEQLDNINGFNWYYNIIPIICQSLLYGVFLCLFPITVHAMVTNGPQSRARKWILAAITFSFTVINAYWIFSVTIIFLSIDSLNNTLMACYGSQNAYACIDGLINFIIADGVVVWRALVLCSDQSKIILMIPVITLAINTVIYLVMVMITAIMIITNDMQLYNHLVEIVTITETAQMTLSLTINIYATTIIGLKAWKHRKLLMEGGIGVRTPRQAIKILALLVESGMVYILICVTTLASIVILTHFQRNDIVSLIFLVGTHLAGIYTLVVVLLVEKNRSLDITYRSCGTIIGVRGDQPPHAGHIAFALGPVLASGGEIDPVTKRPNHDTENRITFDSAGQSSGSSEVSNDGSAVS